MTAVEQHDDPNEPRPRPAVAQSVSPQPADKTEEAPSVPAADVSVTPASIEDGGPEAPPDDHAERILPDYDGAGDIAALVAAKAAGKSLDEIAAAAGVSRSTTQRLLKQPEVRTAYREIREQRLEQLLAAQTRVAEATTERLAFHINSHDASASLRAIGLVLGSTFRLAAAIDVAERVTAIEEKLREMVESDAAGEE